MFLADVDQQAISSTPQACGFGLPSSAPKARISRI
jgi:hypothetical protein